MASAIWGSLREPLYITMKSAMNSGPTNTRKISSTDAAHEVTDTEFDADGTTLRGWVYRPRGQAAAAPAVVLAHGYNCIKELYLDKYAAAFADAGHVVLAYDHRNFGDSDGEPARGSAFAWAHQDRKHGEIPRN